ncbi:MAG: hypothetical protein LAT50_17710 [Ectothiorhodospiraceae bacterium]|nr:hypothetical protein [Ectothiorhodospiraceae bacterium]
MLFHTLIRSVSRVVLLALPNSQGLLAFITPLSGSTGRQVLENGLLRNGVNHEIRERLCKRRVKFLDWFRRRLGRSRDGGSEGGMPQACQQQGQKHRRAT